MSDKNIIPFDLEKFKAGQKAMYNVSKAIVTFLAESSDGTIIYEYKNCSVGYNSCEDMKYRCAMVSRHQHLIDAYDPEDTWQVLQIEPDSWQTYHTGVEPEWDEECEYRLHPHNDLIKAHRNGAKIEVALTVGGTFNDDPNPTWSEDKFYRVKVEPTITVPFPPLPFSLTCGDKPEVRQWLKDNGCEWSSGNDITIHLTSKRDIDVDVDKSVTYTSDSIRKYHVFDPFKQPQPEPTTKTVYEWIYKDGDGDWRISETLNTDSELTEYKGIKTGRSWEVEV